MNPPLPRRLVGFLAFFAFLSPACPQEPVFTVLGTQFDDTAGRAVSFGGDWDLDGIADLAVGFPGVGNFAGAVDLRSGFDGSLIRRISAPPRAREFGSAIDASRDFNSDGTNDLVIGAPFTDLVGTFLSPGAVYVIDGRTSAILHQAVGVQDNDQLGERVLAIEDVTGDTVPEFVATGTGIDGPGTLYNCGGVRVFSGATGVELYTRLGWAQDAEYGKTIASVGDVSGDGRSDWVAGGNGPYPSYVGRIEVCSSATGLPIYTLTGAAQEFSGHSLSRIDDIDGDLKADFLLGKPNHRNASSQQVGRVEARASSDGRVLFAVSGTVAGFPLGEFVQGLDDLDGDRYPDFAAYRSNEVQVFSGRSQTRFWSTSCRMDRQNALAAGDANLGGFADIAIGEELFDPPGARFGGRARLFALADRYMKTRPLTVTMPGNLSIDLGGCVANSGYVVFVVQANGVPIGPYLLTIGACDSNGRATLNTTVPFVPLLQTVDFWGASLGEPLPAIAFTNFARARFQ